MTGLTEKELGLTTQNPSKEKNKKNSVTTFELKH